VRSDHFPRTRALRRLLAIALVLAGPIATVAPTGLASAAAAEDGPGLGCGSAEVTRTLDTGSAWRMCARIDPVKGLVLEQVQFRPASGPSGSSDWLSVIDSLYLAQLVVPYDSGTVGFNDVTGFGFGGYALLAQDDKTCLGETMDVEQSFMFGPDLVERTIPGICLDEVGTGLGWASHEDNDPQSDSYVQQGRALELSSLTKISWYEYQQKVTLTDQGTITVGLGATGDLAPLDSLFSEDPAVGWPINPADNEPARRAQSHWHNAVYRVDFGIGTGEQRVEQWDYTQPDPLSPAHIEGAGTVRTQAFNAPDDVDPQTWWRVLNPTSLNPDGHPRSYEIVNNTIQDPYDPLTRPKVSFTNNHPCQEYASDNLNIGCPNLSVPDYVAAESAPLTDPVAWVNVGFHHVVRDEDQSPMPAHWQEFSLAPRDLLAQQATTPVERSCVNGGPISVYGSCAAVNTVAPRITTGAAVPDVGTALSSDRGTWRAARAELSFSRQWLRDGEPIIGATGIQYVVGAADRGHRISVRINATGEGIVPGSATSSGLLIPELATSRPDPTPTATPTITPPTRTTPTMALTQPRQGLPRLQIRVKGKAGTATGAIVVRGPHGWKRILTLGRGGVTVRVPKALAAKRARLVVRYRGDTHYLSVERSIRLRPGRH
jgi:hypothetical protein